MRRSRVFIFSLVALCCGAAAATERCAAHPATIATATATINADGRVRLTARFDLLAFALNETPALIDDDSMNALLDASDVELQAALDGARDRALNGIEVECAGAESGAPRHLTIQFPSALDVRRGMQQRRRLPVMGDVMLSGQLPGDASSVAFRFPDVLGPIVLTVERSGLEPSTQSLDAGETSAAFVVAPEMIEAPLREPAAPGAALTYLQLGFTHILPHGPDHVLFVLGLFLLSARLGPLLWQVTAFTVAHSITLAMALFGVVRLAPQVVEPLIALSIAFIAVENIFTTRLQPWRPFVVFAFGLVHGLGFAGVLSDLGLPRQQFGTALVSFNIGVELGQLAVIGGAMLVVGWFRQHRWYRRGVVFPASGAIAAIAVFWTVQRVFEHHVEFLK